MRNGISLIFLDVDGVLNDKDTNAKCGEYRGIDDAKLILLKAIVDQTKAKIILISSWKEHWFSSYKSLQDDLAIYLDQRLSQVRLKISGKVRDEYTSGRGEAILKYLDVLDKKGIFVSSFLILDDNDQDYEENELLGHLVQTDFENGGLTSQLAEIAIQILRK